MDGFGDNFDQAEVDPAAEFLAREKDQLAGLEEELKATHLGSDENAGNQAGSYKINDHVNLYTYKSAHIVLMLNLYSGTHFNSDDQLENIKNGAYMNVKQSVIALNMVLYVYCICMYILQCYFNCVVENSTSFAFRMFN